MDNFSPLTRHTSSKAGTTRSHHAADAGARAEAFASADAFAHHRMRQTYLQLRPGYPEAAACVWMLDNILTAGTTACV